MAKDDLDFGSDLPDFDDAAGADLGLPSADAAAPSKIESNAGQNAQPTVGANAVNPAASNASAKSLDKAQRTTKSHPPAPVEIGRAHV